MKYLQKYKPFLFAIVILLPLSGMSQRLVFSYSLGKCGGHQNESDFIDVNYIYDAYMKARLSHYAEYYATWVPSSKQECEAAAAYERSYDYSDYGCNVRVTAYCVGFADNSTPMESILGPQYGSSYNTTNPANEVGDWQKDNEELIKRLGGHKVSNDDGETYVFGSRMPDAINNFVKKEKTFEHRSVEDMVAACDGLTQSYLDNPPADIDEWFRQRFYEMSGYDIASIMTKLGRTRDENQALEDYEKFRKELSERMAKEIDEKMAEWENSDEKKTLDAAILSLDSYGDDTNGWINMTSFRKVEMQDLPEEWKPLKKLIDICNGNREMGSTGFHAEMYYNEITGKYEIAFRGTEFYLKSKSIRQDIDIAEAILERDGQVMQYEWTKVLADKINELPDELKNKLCVTGHSLGGGQASIIGLLTGIETKTFNAATIPDIYLKRWNVEEKVKNGDVQNITAYHTSTDLLTNTQKAFRSSAIGVEQDLGDVTPTLAAMKTAMIGAGVGGLLGAVAALGPNVGQSIGAVGGIVAANNDVPSSGNIIEQGANIGKNIGMAGKVLGVSGSVAAGAVSGFVAGYMGEGHKMIHTTNALYNDNIGKQAEWGRQRYIRNNLISKGNQTDPLTQLTIQIKFD